MEESLQNQLYERYPLVFADRGSKEVRSPLTHRGIECGDGWFGLLSNLCASMEEGIRAWQKENSDEIEKHPRVAQIKEKFGGLCFYMDYPNGFDQGWYNDVECKIIGPANKLSYKTCEICGAEGEKRSLRWIRTLCQTCYEKGKKNDCSGD
jgi:hypothetical protein